jgi:uncharacterized protein (DUF1800 family)
MDEAIIAANRFGYGLSPNGGAAIGRDPRGWLKGQIMNTPVPEVMRGLPDSGNMVVSMLSMRADTKRERQMMNDGVHTKVPMAQQNDDPARRAAREAYQAEVAARLNAAAFGTTPFAERMMAFWANHFTVSGVRGQVKLLAGSYEREAIRPHMFGHFEDLVLAVVQHPAMGYYLDNAVSVGPESMAGKLSKRGLNENLGRELLELHTLGVNGGYTEEDLRAMAKILTGWSMESAKDGKPGRFEYHPQAHEPGSKTLLGQTFPEMGMEEGVRAIRFVSRQPATARHIAEKLARHFVSDDPPVSAVDRLAEVFLKTSGDLAAVSRALIDLPEAWSAYGQKIKSPWDMVVSAAAATNAVMMPEQIAGTLNKLGQPVFMAPQPTGWPDDAASWCSPDAMLRRVEWCQGFADRVGGTTDPMVIARNALGETLDAAGLAAVQHAESRPAALAILLASPAFQRR